MDSRTPFIPPPLPPGIDFASKELVRVLFEARSALGELNGFSFAVPNPLLLLTPSIIRESVESSRIENINSTVEQALQGYLFPEEERRQPDKEVLRYRDAILWGWGELPRLPIGHRLICGIFEKLLPSYGGEYRKLPNAIQNSLTGEVIYTPPPADQIADLMAVWERFQNDASEDIDPLVRAVLLHYQFEAIHPFPDGNGRTGRILLVLSLVQDGFLKLPILYLSAFINRNRSRYYELLSAVTERGAWMDWILFLLGGIVEQARGTTATLQKVSALYQKQRDRIRALKGRIASLEIAEQIFLNPILSPVNLGRSLEVHYTTASRYLKSLEEAGILEHVEYGKYQLYVHRELIEVING
jgi:Fic family protein